MKAFTKKIMILIGCLLCISRVFAQTDSAALIITYNATHLINTQDSFSITYPLLLYVGANYELSISRNKLDNDSLTMINKPEVIFGNNSIIYKPNGKPKPLTSFESLIVLDNRKTDEFTEYINIGPTQYKIADTASNLIRWELVNEYKLIEQYKCQKAKCEFKGRIWEVWFSNEVPIAVGPWKLKGLPGLILEAHDARNEISFQFQSIKKIEKNTIVPFPKNNCSIISRTKYYQMLKEYANDPVGFSVLEQFGLVLNTDELFDKEKMPTKGKLKIPNNPIELQ